MGNFSQRLFATLFLLLSLIAVSPSHAKVFRNAYVSFDLPDTWKCTLEHTEWVCRSDNEKDSREAIIILTAKEVGPTDSFDAYASHLNMPQTSQAKGALPSKVIYAPKQVKINDQVWVDGLHLGSEISTYFTRYLATIKDRIAVLVTFSAHKEFYTKYSQDFFKAIQSLRVIAAKNLLAQPETGPLRPGSETLGAPIGAVMPADMMAEEGGAGGASGSGKTKSLFLAIAVILAAIAGYIFIKMKKKN